MSATAVIRTRSAIAVPAFAVPVGLYVVALAVRLIAMVAVSFPLTEGSAYYVAVARNIATGRGLVVDAIWSYATPPLTLPRAAFELWQPMASLIAAVPMAVFGPTFANAQLGFALFGALLAPLAWLVARDATARIGLPGNRARAVQVGSGILVAVAAPFLIATAIPDSTLPFTVLAVGACVAMPAAARGEARALVSLGVLLALAYLTRMEAIYLGGAFVAVASWAGVRRRELPLRVGAVAAIGAAVALPWWLRNISVFGTPLPGQLAENAFLTRNDQIFAFSDPPTLGGFVAQGPATIASNIGAAFWHQSVDVLFVSASMLTVVGLVTLAVGWRKRRVLTNSPLVALLVYGAIAFVATGVLFPVATLWGTFEHAAGPLLLGFTILAMFGADALVARARAWRRWARPNAWLAPAALIALALPLTALQLGLVSGQAAQRQDQLAAASAVVRSALPVGANTHLITDRPIWLSDALGVSTLALPDEPPASVAALARTFGATAVVVVDATTQNATSLATDTTGCFVRRPLSAPTQAPDLIVYDVAETCR